MYRYTTDIEWTEWDPEVKATLMFIIQYDKILLIRKKRGLGKGKVNGPGGKIEAGESALECAIRETQEEVCIHAKDIALSGELFFQFVDGLSIHATVYRAHDFDGNPSETDEANPFWCPVDQVPFDQMWEDDATWFPYLLSYQYFKAYYIFEDERMLDAYVEIK